MGFDSCVHMMLLCLAVEKAHAVTGCQASSSRKVRSMQSSLWKTGKEASQAITVKVDSLDEADIVPM